MKQPFFSVCIPLFNRGKTIFSTLSSLSDQIFKNFEVKIVIYKCSDNTLEEVKRFFSSDIYEKNQFEYELKYSKKEYDDWNEPIKLANGKYIAMLEGDDQFLPTHLNIAHEYLSNHRNIGIYSTGNQYKKRNKQGKIKSSTFFKHIFSMTAVPPPSETIFIRQDKHNKPYFYDHKSFMYAPEIDLYLRIANDGYDAYYDSTQNVWRYPSSYKKRSWKYFHDPFVIVNRYKNNENINNEILKKTKALITYRAIKNYLKALIDKESSTYDFKNNLIKELGIIAFYKYIIIIIFKKYMRLFLKKMRL